MSWSGSSAVITEVNSSRLTSAPGAESNCSSIHLPPTSASALGAITLIPNNRPAPISTVTTPSASTFAHSGLTSVPMISRSFTSMYRKSSAGGIARTAISPGANHGDAVVARGSGAQPLQSEPAAHRDKGSGLVIVGGGKDQNLIDVVERVEPRDCRHLH